MKIENHPHRQALQADLQQNNAYKPFSEKSNKMINDMSNEELFELCETTPEVQCKECFLYWNHGIVSRICEHLLGVNQSSRSILQWTLDLLSIPNYVIKKGRPHGNRHGKTEEQSKHFIAHILRKRRIKKGFEGIHDRFQNDPIFRESLLSIDRTEEVCIQMDKDAQKDFTYRMTEDEYFRNKKNWWISAKHYRNCTVFTRSLEKSDLHRFLTGNTRNGIRRLLHPAHLGGSGTVSGGAHDKRFRN